MSVDTRLYLSNRWNLDDVIGVINHHLCPDDPVKAQPSDHCASFGHLQGAKAWFGWYHLDAETPLGRFILLSCGQTDTNIKKLRAIGGVLGGLLEESDCEGNLEFIRGRLTDEDGLQYHLKYAVIHGHSGESSPQDIEDLGKSVTEWMENYNPSRH